mgnify:CR=1 FL=1
MSIGQVIKVVREERGLTQSQFAHELFVTQQALSRWEKGTAEPSIDMIRLISTRFEVPMAKLMEMPDNGFCQSCAMPFYRPEDHGTEPDGTRSGDYCNYCYDDGVFLQDYANSDELVAACAPMMAETSASSPASIMARAPVPVSSDGWNSSLMDPLICLRCLASQNAAPSRYDMCRSWPQPCMTPSLTEENGNPVSS